jgi:serine/threonine-protein kinase
LSQVDETVDSRPGALPAGFPSLHTVCDDSDAPCAKVGLVQGSGPHLSSETASLLHYRLKVVATLFLAACLAFWIKCLVSLDLSEPNTRFIFIVHTGAIAVLLACAVSLFASRSLAPHILRLEELLIFASPAVLIFVIQFIKLTVARDHADNPDAAWVIFAFVYGMFIPNTWRRAAAVVGVMCATPVVLYLVMWLTRANVREAMAVGDLVSIFLTMTIAGVASVLGVQIIGKLRRQAFEARQLGQYRLRRLLGTGGMGEVYLADHQMMKRPVAIKLIRPGQEKDPTTLARFEREVRATARLSHWNTIEIFDFGSTACGSFYYVMEYLPGLSLSDLVKQHGPLAPERAIHLLRQVCDGLEEAHGIGLIHRDIKPANIFAAQRGGVYDVAKVLDFGLAKPLSEKGEEFTQLTQVGSITGSPLYMSPEQATGDSEPDARSDIYSLGAVAYYLVTGKPPHDGENPIKVMLSHARDEVTPPSQLRLDTPHDLEQIVLKALAKRPQDRYQDIASFRAALAQCEAADRWTRDDASRWWQTNGQTSEPASPETAEAVA